jgi:hypothetical protein
MTAFHSAIIHQVEIRALRLQAQQMRQVLLAASVPIYQAKVTASRRPIAGAAHLGQKMDHLTECWYMLVMGPIKNRIFELSKSIIFICRNFGQTGHLSAILGKPAIYQRFWANRPFISDFGQTGHLSAILGKWTLK